MKGLLQFSLTITAIIALVISCAKEEPTPELIKYFLTVSAGDGGNVSSTGGSYTAGSELTITATPNSEYVFSGWSNGSTDNPIKVTVNSNQTLTANFIKRKYALNITIEGEGTVIEEVISSGKDYDSGTVVRLTAVPSEGWEFDEWSGNLESNNPNEIIIEISLTEARIINIRFKKTPTYSVKFISVNNPPSSWNLVSHSFHYEHGDSEFLIAGGVNWNDPFHYRPPLIRLKREEDNWNVIDTFNEVEMSEIRNHEFLPNGQGFIIGETGPEWPNKEWPFSNIYIANFNGDNLNWVKVSEFPSFYHDISYGDINGDNISDVVGGHLGSRHENLDNPHLFLGNNDGEYNEQYNVLPTSPEGGCCGDVEIFDLNNNGINEIIRIGGYWENEILDCVEYNADSNSFEIVYSLNKSIPEFPVTDIYTNLKQSTYSSGFKGYMPKNKRFHDFNNDGNIDFINEKDGLTIWYGDGNMNFDPIRLNKQAVDETGLGIWESYYPMSGQSYFDIENDGDIDIVTRHFTLGNPNYNDGINLENMIYINDNGVFKRLNTSKYKIPNNELFNNYPGSMFIPFLRNGKLCFMGSTFHNLGSGPEKVILEIETDIPASYWYSE